MITENAQSKHQAYQTDHTEYMYETFTPRTGRCRMQGCIALENRIPGDEVFQRVCVDAPELFFSERRRVHPI